MVSSYDIMKQNIYSVLLLEAVYMCMSLRIEPREMAEVLVKIRKTALAQEMSLKLERASSCLVTYIHLI
jgi:hypothetical protein